MNNIDSITLIVAIALAAVGLLLGFGRSLRFFTKGIFGILLSVFLVFTFGGMIKGIPAVGELIVKGDEYFAGLWSFLGYLHLGNVIYYVALFFVVQILRIVVVRCVGGLFELDNVVMRFLNRFLGAAFTVAAVLLLLLLVFAVFKHFETSEFMVDFLEKIKNTFLFTLYQHNPVVI